MKKYAYQIDVLRLAAMLFVFMRHCIVFLDCGAEGKYFYETYCMFHEPAVEFFIMLSGMLAAYTFRDFAPGDRTEYKRYARHKAMRLFPMHWVCMILCLPLCVYISGWFPVLRALVPTALLIQSYHRLTCIAINGPTWTISILLLFYLLTPWTMKHVRKLDTLWKCLLLLAVMLVLEHYMYIGLEEYRTAQGRPNDGWFFYSSPHSRILNYGIGLVLGHMLKKFAVRDFIARLATPLEVLSLTAVVLTAVYLPKVYLPMNTLLAMMICIFFVGEGRVSKVLSAEWLRPVSRLSFAFYMCHFVFSSLAVLVRDMIYGKNEAMPLDQCMWMYAGFLFASLMLAWVLHEKVEKRNWDNIFKPI